MLRHVWRRQETLWSQFLPSKLQQKCLLALPDAHHWPFVLLYVLKVFVLTTEGLDGGSDVQSYHPK